MFSSRPVFIRLARYTVVGSLALLGSLSYAEWQEPIAPPPLDNVAPPLSVREVPQEKFGDLTVGGLAVSGRPLLRHTNPTIALEDHDGLDWWLQADANSFYFRGDRTNNGLWGDDGPPALRLYENTLAFGGFRAIAAFSHQVRAVEYCDRSGNNCWNAAVDGVSNAGSVPTLPSCATGQTLEYSGSGWECAEDDTGSGLSLPISCSSGQALTGIDARGRAQCAALPPRECVHRDRTYASGYTCLTGTESASVGATRYWYRTCTHEGVWLHGQYTSTGRSSYPRC